MVLYSGRFADEDFATYKQRCKDVNKLLRSYLKGRLIWNARVNGAYVNKNKKRG